MEEGSKKEQPLAATLQELKQQAEEIAKDPEKLRELQDQARQQTEQMAADILNSMGQSFYKNACSKGFYDNPVEDGTRLMLIVSEIAETLEALRHGCPQSEKIPDFTNEEEELADALIRILDYCAHKKLRIGEAVVAKHKFNTGRSKMHGGKKF